MQYNNLYSKNNIFLLNNLKGLSILFIFAVHSAARCSVEAFYPLGMPIFAFASGFAAKSNDNRINIKYLCTLCSIYLLSNLLYSPFSLYLMYCQNEFNIPFLILGPNAGILWYFIALIIWYFITPIFKATKHPLVLSILFCALAYTLVQMLPISRKAFQWGYIMNLIDMVFRFYPYYILGCLITWEKILDIRSFKYKYILILPLLVIFALYGTSTLKYYPKSYVFLHEFLYFICAMYSLIASLAIFPGMKLPFLSKVGVASLNIYIFHFYIDLILNKIFVKTIGYSPIPIFLLFILIFSWFLSSDRVSYLLSKGISATKKLIFSH